MLKIHLGPPLSSTDPFPSSSLSVFTANIHWSFCPSFPSMSFCIYWIRTSDGFSKTFTPIHFLAQTSSVAPHCLSPLVLKWHWSSESPWGFQNYIKRFQSCPWGLLNFPGLLDLGAVNTWYYTVLWSGDCPVHRGMFSDIIGLYSSGVSSMHPRPPSCNIQKYLQTLLYKPWPLFFMVLMLWHLGLPDPGGSCPSQD